MSAQAHGPRASARGITLIECVIAMGILAALMSIALPSFGELMARARLRGAAEELAIGLGNARMESVRQGAGLVHVSFKPGSAWCWAVGPVADIDCRNPPAGTLSVVRAEDYAGVTMTQGVNASFDGRSALSAAGLAAEFTSAQGQELRVQITPLGRATICAPRGSSLDFPRC